VRSPDVRGAAKRVAWVRAFGLLAFALLALRAAHLSVVDERGALRGAAQTERVLTLAAQRGAIVDRSGVELALSVDAPSVYAMAGELDDAGAAARELARALGEDRRRLARRLRGREGFVFLARWVSREQAERVRALDLRGVGVLEEPRRVYPQKELAAKVLGIANIDGAGVRGIERQEDAWLRGVRRALPAERDARGRLLVKAPPERLPTAGGDVSLTLDAALQAATAEALRDAVRRTGARGGIALSLHPRSGEILALAEEPSFDPNRFRDTPFARTRSRAFLDALEPGSTLKPFLVAGALESGAVAPDTVFDCEGGAFRVPGKTIRDSHPHGELSVRDIVRVSSNIGAIKIARELGARPHHEMLRRFGFGSPTGSGFPGESAGLLRPAERWQPLDQAAIAFGQGLSVTTVQLAAATAALANGGEWVQPRLVRARRAPGGEWTPARRGEVRFVVRPETAAATLAIAASVVSRDGTGRLAALRDVRVAGKTGTAQKLDPKTGRYAEDRFVAWFIGIAPVDSPKLVVVAALDEPQRPLHTGGGAAAPLFARVATPHLARLGVDTAPVHPAPALPTQPATRTARREPAGPAPAPPRAAALAAAPAPPARLVAAASDAPAPPEVSLARIGGRVLLPDFRGLTRRQVERATAGSPLAMELSGSGRAVSQDPPPGTVVGERGARVRVRFEGDET